MKNAQEFWNQQHNKKSGLWLTGTRLPRLCDIHEIDIPENQTVIEIGVGFGYVTHELAKNNTVYAVDISQSALDNLSGVSHKYLTKDMTLIPDSIADIIICHLVFQHCEDEAIDFLIRESLRLVKSDGFISLQTADCQSPANQYKKWTGNRKLVWRRHSDVENIILKYGGKIIKNKRTVKRHLNTPIEWCILHVTKGRNGI